MQMVLPHPELENIDEEYRQTLADAEGYKLFLLDQADDLVKYIAEVDNNLSTLPGLTPEGIAEMQKTRASYENDLEALIEEGTKQGYFSDGAPNDSYEELA